MNSEQLHKEFENQYKDNVMRIIDKSDVVKNLEKKLRSKLDADRVENSHKKRKDIIDHSKYVMRISREIYAKSCKVLDEDLIDESSFLHDISKYEELPKENREEYKHNVLGYKYILKNYSELEFTKERAEKIADIVRYHRGKKLKIDSEDLEYICMIVRDADKISKILKRNIWINKSVNKDEYIEKVEKKINKEVGELCLLASSKIFKEYKGGVKEFIINKFK